MWLTPYTEQAARDQTNNARQARLRGDYEKTRITKNRILNLLDEKPGISAEEICSSLGITVQYTRTMLNKLYDEQKVDSWKVRTGAHSWVQKWIAK